MKKWLDMRRCHQLLLGNSRRYKGKTAAPVLMGTAGALVGAQFGPVGASVGYMLGATLGQMLFPIDADVQMPPAANYPVQGAAKGTPIQKVYGTRKVAGNVVWYGDATPYTVKNEQSGGKGGTGGGTTTSEVKATPAVTEVW